MKAKELLLLVCISVVALAACALADDKSGQNNKGQAQYVSPKPKPPPAVATKAVSPSDFPVIGYLEKRGQTITIKAGPKGPVYSAKTTEGKILFENLSAEQLRAKAPELHQFFKTAVANGAGKPGVVLDATLHVR